MSYRKATNAFNLTESESCLLALSRSGMSHVQIGSALGLSSGSLGNRIVQASEKQRLLILAAQDKRSPGATTNMHRAKGGSGTVVDVRKGRWKTG